MVAPSILPGAYIERRQADPQALLEPGRAHLLVGPRQAGKSTLIWRELGAVARRRQGRILFLNIEEHALRAWCHSPAGFLADLHELELVPDFLFLDEVQWLDNAALFIKGLIDLQPPFPVLVTGSSSFHLHDRMRESLAGRATHHQLLPLSLAEVCPAHAGAVGDLSRRDALRRHLVVGGYPRAWLADNPASVLGELVQAFVLRDASDLFAVERLDAFQQLLQLCARQVGNLVNIAEFASLTGIAAGTVARYLTLMEEALLLRLVPAFSGGRRREVTSARKVFFVDNGLRLSMLGKVGEQAAFAADRGALYENWVFSELIKYLPWLQAVRYWRSLSGAEVDFVIDGPAGLLGIEVKAAALRRPRLSRSSRSFIASYHPGSFWVLNSELHQQQELDGTMVYWACFHDLPELVARWLAKPFGVSSL